MDFRYKANKKLLKFTVPENLDNNEVGKKDMDLIYM